MKLNKKPKGWRTGQTIFNFLQWLQQQGICESNQSIRMGDPFYIPDKELEKHYERFLKEGQ